MIRAGCDVRVTAPSAAVTVTGNAAALDEAGWDALDWPDWLAVLLAELHAATAAAVARAASAAAMSWAVRALRRGMGVFTGGFLPDNGQEGETADSRRRASTIGGARVLPGRIALPTRADVVRRGRSRPGFGPCRMSRREPSQLRDSAGMAPVWADFTGFATWHAVRTFCDPAPVQ